MRYLLLTLSLVAASYALPMVDMESGETGTAAGTTPAPASVAIQSDGQSGTVTAPEGATGPNDTAPAAAGSLTEAPALPDVRAPAPAATGTLTGGFDAPVRVAQHMLPDAPVPDAMAVLAVAARAEVPAQADRADLREVEANVLNMRSGPSTQYPVVGVLTGGLTVVAKKRDGGWVRVQAPEGVEGWVSARYLARSDDA